MLAATKVKSERQRKKCVLTRKFHVVIVSNDSNEMYTKVRCTCKAVFC